MSTYLDELLNTWLVSVTVDGDASHDAKLLHATHSGSLYFVGTCVPWSPHRWAEVVFSSGNHQKRLFYPTSSFLFCHSFNCCYRLYHHPVAAQPITGRRLATSWNYQPVPAGKWRACLIGGDVSPVCVEKPRTTGLAFVFPLFQVLQNLEKETASCKVFKVSVYSVASNAHSVFQLESVDS